MGNPVIGPMSLADLDGVIVVEKASFLTPWSRHAFEQELTHNIYARYLVAKDGDMVAGYAGMWTVLDEAHVTNVAVHPEYRGTGLGERLMRALIVLAAAAGCSRMTLEVRVSNTVARNLYTKLGFAGAGLRPGYYTDTREDALIMWKDDVGKEQARV